MAGKTETAAPYIELEKRLAKAMGHPIRVDALRIFSERVSSPIEVAKQLHIPVKKISHHVKVLRDCECIELVRTEPVRGATAHYYRATDRPMVTDEILAALPPHIREMMAAMSLGSIFERVGAALRDGSIDRRTDRHMSWIYLTLDEEGWAELVASKAAQLEEEIDIKARALVRLSESGEPGFSVFSSQLAFEAPVID